MEVEQGTFTPLVIGTNGGMGRECRDFITRLAELIALEDGEEYSVIKGWIRARLSFEILKSCLLCVRGSRTPWRREELRNPQDFEMMTVDAGMRLESG